MQGLVQYALAEPLMDEMVQAPGSFAGAYKAVVIALTGLGGCLILLCLALAAAVRRWDSSAGELRLPMPFTTDLTQTLLYVLSCQLPSKDATPQADMLHRAQGTLTDLTHSLLFVLSCSCLLKVQIPRRACCTKRRKA